MEVKKYLKQKLFLSSLVFFSYVIMEAIMFINVYSKPFSHYFMLDILIGLILSSILFLSFSSKFDKIYTIFIMIFMAFVAIVNINYFHVFGDMFSLHYISLAFKGVTLLKISYLHIPSLIIILALLLIFIILTLKLIKPYKMKNYTQNLKKEILKYSLLGGVSLIMFSLIVYISSLNGIINKVKENEDPIIVDAVTINKNSNIEKYGILTYYIREVKYLITSHDDITVDEKIDKYLLEGKSKDNSYTGLLSNYNVLTIMIETGSKIMVNETLTPNLYNLMNSSINCNNNASKNKTNISEMIGICGSSNSKGIEDNDELYLDFSLPNILSEDYNTIYVHPTGGDLDLYNRKELIYKYGFEQAYFFSDLHPEDEMWTWAGDYTLDSLTMSKVADIIKAQEEKFYMFYTTLSMHGPYVDSANQELLESMYLEKLLEAKENKTYVNPIEKIYEEALLIDSEAELSDDYKCIDLYMMAAMDFDKGLGIIIDGLKEKGIYDETLIVLYGDHEIYYTGYDDAPLNFVLSQREDYTYYDIYQTVMVVSNPLLNQTYYTKNNKHTFDKFTSPYVIVPTILDLLGYKYNNNFYIGKSLFDESYSDNEIFYSFELTSFFNSNYYSYGKDKIINSFVSDDATLEADFLNRVNEIIKKQAYLDIIYSKDYFSKYSYDRYVN